MVKSLNLNYQKEKEKSLWCILVDYCTINKIHVLYKYLRDEVDPKKFYIDIKELKCFVDLWKSNISFQKFIQILYNYKNDSKDSKTYKPAKIQQFIQEIFFCTTISNLSLKKKYL